MLKDRVTWRAAVCGVTKSQSQLSDWKTGLDSKSQWLHVPYSIHPSSSLVLTPFCPYSVRCRTVSFCLPNLPWRCQWLCDTFWTIRSRLLSSGNVLLPSYSLCPFLLHSFSYLECRLVAGGVATILWPWGNRPEQQSHHAKDSAAKKGERDGSLLSSLNSSNNSGLEALDSLSEVQP